MRDETPEESGMIYTENGTRFTEPASPEPVHNVCGGNESNPEVWAAMDKAMIKADLRNRLKNTYPEYYQQLKAGKII